MNMEQIPLTAVVATIIVLAPVIYWCVDLVKDLKDAVSNGKWNGACTKVLALLIAFGLANLVAHSGINIGGSGHTLENLSWQALLVACLFFASGSGLISDHLRAKNPADTTVKSKLLDD
jgi:hypothetical protein